MRPEELTGVSRRRQLTGQNVTVVFHWGVWGHLQFISKFYRAGVCSVHFPSHLKRLRTAHSPPPLPTCPPPPPRGGRASLRCSYPERGPSVLATSRSLVTLGEPDGVSSHPSCAVTLVNTRDACGKPDYPPAPPLSSGAENAHAPPCSAHTAPRWGGRCGKWDGCPWAPGQECGGSPGRRRARPAVLCRHRLMPGTPVESGHGVEKLKGKF